MINRLIFKGKAINVIREDGKWMVDATQMGKAFDKRPSRWLDLIPTKKIMEEVAKAERKRSGKRTRNMDWMLVTKNAKTMMCPALAIEYARYLDAEFCEFLYRSLDTLTEPSVPSPGILHPAIPLSIPQAEQSETFVPQSFSDALRTIADLVDDNARLRAENARLSDLLASSPIATTETEEYAGDLTLAEFAAEVQSQTGVEMGQNRLFEWLTKNGYLTRNSIYDASSREHRYRYRLTQQSVDLEVLRLTQRNVHVDGKERTQEKVQVTEKGRGYFLKLFGEIAAIK